MSDEALRALDDEEARAAALAELIRDEVLHFVDRRYLHDHTDEIAGRTTLLVVVCSQLFGWGGTDCEDLPFDEILPLYQARRGDPAWGVAKWCCRRRGMQPQRSIREALKKAGAWDADMQALSRNPDES